MIIEEIRKQISKSEKSRYRISQDTGIDEAALSRIMNGGSCKVETADILFKYFGIELIQKKRKCKQELNKSELKEMLEQVQYEYKMMSVIGDFIINSEFGDNWLKYALLESFLVHTRNLIDFLYTDNAKFSDDILAVDYFDSPNKWITKRGMLPKYLEEVKAKANKLLSHITLSRIKKYKNDKGWNVQEITNKLDKVFQCFVKENNFNKVK